MSYDAKGFMKRSGFKVVVLGTLVGARLVQLQAQSGLAVSPEVEVLDGKESVPSIVAFGSPLEALSI